MYSILFTLKTETTEKFIFNPGLKFDKHGYVAKLKTAHIFLIPSLRVMVFNATFNNISVIS
jgi:hypothetical protein